MSVIARTHFSRRLALGAAFMAVSQAFFASAQLHAIQATALQSASMSKLEFEAASVRPDDNDQQEPSSFPLTTDDSYPLSVTLFRADFTLDTYIAFAYKVWETPRLRHDLLAGQPKWVGEQRYRVQARIPENATKDQVRLMTQSLLAERFGLKVHFETRDVPVLALSLAKSGKLGPKLKNHAGGPCSPQETATDSGDVFPPLCGDTQMKSDGPLALVGARNITLDKLASFLDTYGYLNGEFDRDVIDETGLHGQYDYTIRFARKSPGDDSETDIGPSLVEALRDQLGMKLTSKRAAVKRSIIDHVERPSEN
jgi:uncharacterized protein (TIGR03435 family)